MDLCKDANPLIDALTNLQQIIEGLMTVVVAVGAWFIIVDFPDKAEQKGLLSGEQAAYIAQRIDNDRNDAVPDPLTWAKFLHHLKDWKLWVLYVDESSTPLWVTDKSIVQRCSCRQPCQHMLSHTSLPSLSR